MQQSNATFLSVGAAAGGLAPGPPAMGGPPVAGKTDWYWSSFDLSSMFSISRSLMRASSSWVLFELAAGAEELILAAWGLGRREEGLGTGDSGLLEYHFH